MFGKLAVELVSQYEMSLKKYLINFKL